MLDQFENDLKNGEAVSIAEPLRQVPKDRQTSVCQQLVSIEIHHRIERLREEVVASDYRQFGDEVYRHAQKVIERHLEEPTEDRSLSDTSPAVSTLHHVSNRDRIGPYELIEEIGKGGMGVVWKARQHEPIRRDVALKLMKSSQASKDAITRFGLEQNALAKMDNENIAKILDAGSTRYGEPYFVMDLIDGIKITEYCDKNRLSISERLKLFIPVCKAVHHAHQKGVIHRDLKPQNVLVTEKDDRAVPVVIDFGLAKAMDREAKITDETWFTEQGRILGTYQYMSPEQAESSGEDVDTRTDIYSLGVMLYELLAGSPPLEKSQLVDSPILKVLSIIRDEEPPLPSKRLSSSGELLSSIGEQRQVAPTRLQKILQGELDCIVMKALD